MNKEYLKKYCEVIIKAGVNLYEGQSLVINSGARNFEFALMLGQTAYENGAKYVDLNLGSDYMRKFRIDNNKNSSDLEFIPNYTMTKANELLANDWASIKVDNTEEIDVLKDSDSSKFQIMSKAEHQAFSHLSKSLTSFRNVWTIVAVPGPKWAGRILNMEAGEKSERELWEKIIPIMRLDTENPVEEWKKHSENLVRRSKTLTELKLDKLVFTAPGTNLEIGINKTSVWRGGFATGVNGRKFIPNLPTEEVFTTPDFKRTNGKVRVTKPVKVLETQLYGIWFEFKDGKVVNFGADNNVEILEKYFKIDEGASYLGEVALVDGYSKVFESGLIFNSILYDENAACHIALGRGFTSCLSNGDELTNNEKMKAGGCNFSLVHTDFMIGSHEINVKGYTQSGEETAIITNGKFNID
ncbi:MAG: aminopeptidase [Bacteroidetes bacterium]|nr:aminopeptidase [Bacteroidota bacterium]MBX7045565.1 aminopeptidase [Ignavibacteria bacterium]